MVVSPELLQQGSQFNFQLFYLFGHDQPRVIFGILQIFFD